MPRRREGLRLVERGRTSEQEVREPLPRKAAVEHEVAGTGPNRIPLQGRTDEVEPRPELVPSANDAQIIGRLECCCGVGAGPGT